MEAQGEELLQDLITHEQRLVAKVDEARREADEILKQARAEAQRIQRDAERQAERLAKKQAETTEAEAGAIRDEVLSAAREEVAKIEASAKAHRKDAVKFVLEKVMP